jgi:uncharacterized protein involved in exopolysaccharide biosynthesis
VLDEGEPAEGPVAESELKERLKALLRSVGLLPPRADARDKALRKYQKALEVSGVKDSNVIHLNFAHPDRDAAILILKTHLDDYFEKRTGLFGPPGGNVLETVLIDREKSAAEAEAALDAYKGRYDITIIESELRNAFERELQVRQQILQTEVALTQAQGKEVADDPISDLSGEALSDLRSSISGLKRARAELDKKLAEVNRQIRALEAHKTEIERLDERVKSSRRQLQIIRDKVEEMRLERALTDTRWGNVRVVEPPHALQVPDGLSAVAKILVAGLLGLLAAIGLLAGLTMSKASPPQLAESPLWNGLTPRRKALQKKGG